jgi:hypothetical protein
MLTCSKCGTAVDEPIGFRSTCSSCHAFLHSCVNCRLYSPSSHNHCLSSTTEYVRDAEAGNFCEEFDPAAPRKALDAKPPAKNRFDQLFGD